MAKAHRIHLLNLFDVFNADTTVPPDVLALVLSFINKADPSAYAELSDIVRWLIPWLLGVTYVDGENLIGDGLIKEMLNTLKSTYGFRMDRAPGIDTFGNTVISAPAGIRG